MFFGLRRRCLISPIERMVLATISVCVLFHVQRSLNIFVKQSETGLAIDQVVTYGEKRKAKQSETKAAIFILKVKQDETNLKQKIVCLALEKLDTF